jgi:hypothetical protein
MQFPSFVSTGMLVVASRDVRNRSVTPLEEGFAVFLRKLMFAPFTMNPDFDTQRNLLNEDAVPARLFGRGVHSMKFHHIVNILFRAIERFVRGWARIPGRVMTRVIVHPSASRPR